MVAQWMELLISQFIVVGARRALKDEHETADIWPETVL